MQQSSQDDVMSVFAQQVKRRRALAELSLAELAKRSGVSKANVSKIERREIRPSLDVAARLAEALGSTLSEMLHQMPRARAVLQRAGEHVQVTSDDGMIRRTVLSPTFDQSDFELVRFELEPGAASGVFPPHRYGSEEYIYVITGRVLVSVGDQSFLLKAGDSLYYEAQCEHELSNPGRRRTEGIAVIRR